MTAIPRPTPTRAPEEPPVEFVSLHRPAGAEIRPAMKRLPCGCTLHCDEPPDRATQTIRVSLDHAACDVGHEPVEIGQRSLPCACSLRAEAAEGARQAFVIDYSRCAARDVPVPPSAFPRP